MSPQQKLQSLLARGYFAHSQAEAANDAATADMDLRIMLQAEYDRLQTLEKSIGCPLAMRDYAADAQLKFLRVVMSKPFAIPATATLTGSSTMTAKET